MPDQNSPQSPLSLLPFPPLVWQQDYAWEGTATFSAWAGFQSRHGPYASTDSSAASDGTVTVTVVTPDNKPSPPSAEQAAAYRFLAEQQDAVQEAVLAALLAEYPRLQELYDYGYDPEAALLMPDVADLAQFRTLIGLSTVHVLTPSKDGLAYIGFEFGCTWDEEHGLGAMTHAGRVIEVGQADTAFLGWIAARDAEKEGLAK